MLINTDLSTDSALAGRQDLRATTSQAASQTSSNSAGKDAASQIDPFLERLSGVPGAMQDDTTGIQDSQGAAEATEAVCQSILRQPDTALAAQAGQSRENVLKLLQPAD